jgi:hypothetical protein
MVQRFRFRRDVFFEEFSREFSLLNALEMLRGTNTNTTDQNREDDDEYDDTESNDKHETAPPRLDIRSIPLRCASLLPPVTRT